jgi:hypothetical protein
LEEKERNPLTSIKIGIVADLRRREQAEQLADKVDATVLCFDDGIAGVTKNHIRTWTRLQQYGAEWLVVLEDDAVPVDDFRYQLTQALINAPTDIVSLYLGTGYPKAWQRFIRTALTEARKADANYLVSTHVLHGVGVAIKSSLVDDMLRMVGWMSQDQRTWPVDEQITHWARMRAHRVAYTRPSLVDHMDGESLVVHPDGEGREGKRVAHEVGSRHLWVPTTVEMP